MPPVRGDPERSEDAAPGFVDERAGFEQVLHHFGVPFPRRHRERRVSPVAAVGVGAGLQERVQRGGPDGVDGDRHRVQPEVGPVTPMGVCSGEGQLVDFFGILAGRGAGEQDDRDHDLAQAPEREEQDGGRDRGQRAPRARRELAAQGDPRVQDEEDRAAPVDRELRVQIQGGQIQGRRGDDGDGILEPSPA